MGRCPSNCVHNYTYTPEKLPYSSTEIEHDLSPRRTTNLVVIQNPKPISICTFGSGDPGKWNGDICDSDDIAKSCPKFASIYTFEEAKKEFETKMSDDKFVMEKYPDVANLQWVLDERTYHYNGRWFQYLFFWILSFFIVPEKQILSLKNNDLPEGLWDDVDTKNPGA